MRAAELASALISWIRPIIGTGSEWQVAAAFVRGYRGVLGLTDVERAAIPALIPLARATAWVHWLGLHRAGLCGEDAARDHLESLLSTARWVDANRTQLEALLN